jgi:hypothetical protein
MNWKLVFQLSLFGLAMGIATVFVIPSNIEPLFWLPILLVCAYLIATRAPANHFLHGLCVGLANSVWITGAHMLLFDQYVANHPQEAAMMASMPAPLQSAPRLLMAIVGPMIGLVTGAALGILAIIASKLFARRVQSSAS